MTHTLHTQKSLDALTWNEVQKIHASLGLKATATTRTRRDYQRRIVDAQPQPVVEVEQVATPLTCATCPLAILLEDNRYECGAKVTNSVTRGHWEANSDCYQEIANLEVEMTELIAVAEVPATSSAPSETQPEAPITPVKRAIPFFFNLPLPEYVAFAEKQSVPCCLESTTRDRAKEYKEQLQLAHEGYKIYGGNEPPTVDFWQIHAYLQLVNRSASYTEVTKNAGSLDATECLEFIIASECPFIFHELEDGKQYFNYAPLAKYVWATDGCRADIGTDVTMYDSIYAIAERIRSVLDESKNFAKYPQPNWYVEMMAEIREHQKSLPDAPKPSKLYTKLCQELEVGDYLKTDYAVTRRRTQIVAAKKILPDGRIHFILNCGINPREVFSQEVWLDAPITQPTITEPVTPETVATTTDDTLPNQGDNGRGRVTALTALPEATIVLPHATKPKADDNFMSSMVKENAFDKAFYDMTYLLEQQLKAQLAVERTVIGSEDEAIALMHLKKIDEDIEYYDRPVIEPQPSPIVVQLENQMKELKADTLKLFKIEPFDQSILPTETDEPEQSATQSKPEPEGTIHWTTPQRGVIIGKKGATRHFYIRNDEIFIVLSGEFTASETKHPNIRHRQIREAINLGRTFNPRIFKVSPNFERDTQVRNGGRIRQGCDGRWWAWADNGVTGQPFLSENLATQYLDRVAASKQEQRQTPCIK